MAPGAPARGDETEPPRPAPRGPDGRVSFAGTPDEVGNWNGPAAATLANNIRDGEVVVDRYNLPENLTVDQVPFRPWARKLYDERQATLTKDDPHTRCKPSGGPRMFHTPYGFEVLDLPETEEIIFLGVGNPHSWKVVHMDGRPHPKDLKPTAFGHSIGHWEGDTLVVDTIGFNGKFWITREGLPHTAQLRVIERISRPEFDELRYEATIDDPGAYTRPWSGGWFIPWGKDNEPFDYVCQENNLDPQRMVGPQEQSP
jgi:hypothetical protein